MKLHPTKWIKVFLARVIIGLRFLPSGKNKPIVSLSKGQFNCDDFIHFGFGFVIVYNIMASI